MERTTIITLFGTLMLVASWLIGVYFTRIHRSLASYYVAERGLPTFVILMATAATYMSGWTFVGGPGLGYAYGFSYLWSTLLALYLPWVLMSYGFLARKYRIMADTHGAMTNADVALERYKSRWISGLVAVSCFMGWIAYLSAQVKSLGWIMNVIFGWSFETGTVVGLLILTSYTALGGVHAAVFADVFQGVLMALGSVLVAMTALWLVGGPGPAYEGVKAVKPALGYPSGTWPGIVFFGFTIASAVGSFNWPHISMRYFMIRNLAGFRWLPIGVALITASMGLLAYLVPYGYMALMARGDPGAPPLKVAETVMPTFLLSYMPASVSGVILAGVLAAILSTASGFITAGSAAIVRDLWQRAFQFPLRNELLWARLASVVVVFLAWILGLTAPEFIVLMGVAASGIWAATIVPVINFGICWRGASKTGALVTLIWGLPATVLGQMGQMYGWWTLPGEAEAATFTVPISIALFIVVSKLTNPRREVPADMELILRMPLINRQPRLPLARVPAGGSGEKPGSPE